MAGEWLKVEHSTPEKPEVLRMSRQLGITADDAFGKFFRMWRWFDKETIGGRAVGIGPDEIDYVVGAIGFAACAIESGWLVVDGNDLLMPEFAKHCGEGAKTRGLTAWRVARHSKTNAATVSPALPRKEKGEREEEEEIPYAKGPNGEPNGQSHMDNSFSKAKGRRTVHPSKPVGEPLDLSGVDWDRVMLLADALGKRVPAHTENDRRQWFKFAVMVEHGMFSEDWLLDSAEAVRVATSHKKNRQAHLVAVLKSKAAADGVEEGTFKAILRGIEIPPDVWRSNSVRVKHASH